MQLALCPACMVVHEVVSPTALVDRDEERAYELTHCQLCETSAGFFLPLQDATTVSSDGIGCPAAVVPIFAGKYCDWWTVSPDHLTILAQAGLRVRLVRHLADEMRLRAELVAEWIGLPLADVLKPMPGKALELNQGLRLLWLARLIGQAQTIVDSARTVTDFGAAPWAGAWLQASHPALGGERPGDYLCRPDGPQAVSDLLARMESGAYS